MIRHRVLKLVGKIFCTRKLRNEFESVFINNVSILFLSNAPMGAGVLKICKMNIHYKNFQSGFKVLGSFHVK